MGLYTMSRPCRYQDFDWIPHRYLDKYRRFVVNIDRIDRDDLKKLERNIVRAFRYAFMRYYLTKGYRISSQVLRNPERYGPTPGIIWIRIRNDHEYDVVVGDSSIPLPNDGFANIFITEFMNRLKEKGYNVDCISLVDARNRYSWGDAQRLIYVSLTYIKREEQLEL